LQSRYLKDIKVNPNLDIWNVWSLEFNSIHVIRREPNLFQVIRDGLYTPVLRGQSCSLIDKKYKPVFKRVSKDQVTIEHAIVRDFQFNTEVKKYIELKIVNTIDYKTIHSADSSGLKVWHFNGSIFVSGELKAKLLRIGEQELAFSLGFSLWG
jgi:hypothetical protein